MSRDSLRLYRRATAGFVAATAFATGFAAAAAFLMSAIIIISLHTVHVILTERLVLYLLFFGYYNAISNSCQTFRPKSRLNTAFSPF